MPDPITGLGVSPGTTAGPVRRMGTPPALPAEIPTIAAPAAEVELAAGALRLVATCWPPSP